MQAGEQHLRNVFEHIPIGIVECALDGKIVDVNEVFCRVVGFERGELLGRRLEDLIHEADFAVEIGLQEKLLAGQIALYELEKRYIRKDGEAIWVRITRSLIRDPDPQGASGGIPHIVSTVLDISERKRFESQLQVQADLLDNVHDAIIAVNERLEITSWNRAAEQLYGWRAEEVLGRSMPEVVRSELTSERRAQTIREVDANGRAVTETTHHHRDGHAIPVESSGVALRPGGTRVTGYVSINRDITARRQAENALRELNQRLEERVRERTLALEMTNKVLRESEATAHLLLDNDPDAVVITDEKGRIVHANRQLETMFGYKTGEIMGMPVEMLIPGRYHDQHVRHRREFQEHEGQRSMGVARRVVGLHKEGMEFPVDVVLTPIPDIPGWDVMVTIRDSTDRKRIEDALEESRRRLQALTQRLVEVQEDERRAMARELHDRVGQSLSALKMILSTVGDELTGGEGQPARERLDDAVEVTSEMISLVRNMMNELRPPILDEYGLEAALESYLSQYRERYGLEVVLAGPGTPLPRLGSAIETSLLRIAQEALTNAARHSGAKRVTVRLERAGGVISLSVEDNGCGILSWDSANRGGVHGLTIMRERAEAFGGELRIRSEPRLGTTIEARIPVAAPAAAASQ